MLQDLSFILTLKILFFFMENLKKFYQIFMNYVLLKNVKCKVMLTEVYLEPSQTSETVVFCL